MPQSRFCTAKASAKTSRPQLNSRLIGCMKKPTLERGPKVRSPISEPQTTITSGERQPRPRAESGMLSVVAMGNSFVLQARRQAPRVRQHRIKSMHSHVNDSPASPPAQGSDAEGLKCRVLDSEEPAPAPDKRPPHPESV